MHSLFSFVQSKGQVILFVQSKGYVILIGVGIVSKYLTGMQGAFYARGVDW